MHTAAFTAGLVAHNKGLRAGHVPVVDDYLNAVNEFSGGWWVSDYGLYRDLIAGWPDLFDQ